MSGGARTALLALCAPLLLPGACAALFTPIAIMALPSLWTDSGDALGYSNAGLVTWGLGALIGLAGFWLIRRMRAR